MGERAIFLSGAAWERSIFCRDRYRRDLFRKARKAVGWKGVVPRGGSCRDGSELLGQFEIGKRRMR